MTKRKSKELAAMEDAVQKMFGELAPGAKIQFDADEALSGYRKGRPLNMLGVKKAAAEKRPVWVYCKAHDEDSPRSNHAFRVTLSDDGVYFGFEDGSSWAHDMEVGPDEAVAADGKHGWGVLQIFEAVK